MSKPEVKRKKYDYHESKITWDDFPKRWEDEVLRIMSEVEKSE